MNWPADNLGASAIVYPGMASKDHTRAAIQLLSGEIPERRIYAHTGWLSSSDGGWAFLHSGGAVGNETLDVELPQELCRYSLPQPPAPDDARSAMAASLRLLEVADREEMLALWALVYLAPLSSILEPDSLLWLYGASGSMKTTRAALATSHFGQFDYKSLPANFISTDNAIERRLFLLKDVLAVVDDYAPQTNAQLAAQMDRTAERLLRMVGDRAGRARMRSDTSLRPTYHPRGVVMATGEQEPPGAQSSAARALVQPCRMQAVSLRRLSAAQSEQHLYPSAMAAYIEWLMPQMDELKVTLPAARNKLRDHLQRGGHGRLPVAIANLATGLLSGLRFALEIGAIGEAETTSLYDEGVAVFSALAVRQERRLEDREPTRRFAAVLYALLSQRRVYLKNKSTGRAPMLAERWGWERAVETGSGDLETFSTRPQADAIGWVDEEFVYLMPDAYYLPVARFCRETGESFPVREWTLRDHLARIGALEHDPEKRTRSVYIEGRSQRVLCLKREAFERLADVAGQESNP